MKNIVGIGVILLIAVSFAESASFSYTAQDEWPGICVMGNTGRQSPIDIVTEDVEEEDDLAPLKFSSVFYAKISGDFENTCQNVEFTPSVSVNAIIDTPVGMYKLKQFHFHWGKISGEGSEHLVNGKAEEFEIHFVSENILGTNTKAGDALAVIAVRGEVSNDPIQGIFKELDASLITEVEASIHVSNIVLADLLPKNRDYYFYEGSLTTPNCDETVQWFVLKHTIQVSVDYLEQLRKIEMDEEGNRLTFNFRAPQDLNGRLVLTPEEVSCCDWLYISRSYETQRKNWQS